MQKIDLKHHPPDSCRISTRLRTKVTKQNMNRKDPQSDESDDLWSFCSANFYFVSLQILKLF